ncbi:MAG TPA: tRNA (adenosine(37)-N6)-threonylcarbamoyltransferase complex dimerization subunit type 1 TsaB [Pyrinomonadaceae bacterium]|nr:tRNA (adenosine(37)-N6)-threonylcarbamoyltransferase complex dimerization subunit type 1 TsaB [Pyrinomonadaceae bacterium]
MPENREPLILAVETGTRAGSVGLARGGEVLSAVLGDASSSHSTDLIDNIERVLRKGNAKLFDVDLFAVTVGPGSFTGLRIGLATVKAFAVCVQRPCAAVSTLAAVAHAAGDSETTVSILPAGRGEVYAQAFSVRGEIVQALDGASHIKPSELVERYGKVRTIRLAGEGAHQHIETFRQCAVEHRLEFGEGESAGAHQAGWSLAPQPEYLANSVAALALSDYRDGKATDARELRANYVRASDAEIHERWLQQNS